MLYQILKLKMTNMHTPYKWFKYWPFSTLIYKNNVFIVFLSVMSPVKWSVQCHPILRFLRCPYLNCVSATQWTRHHHKSLVVLAAVGSVFVIPRLSRRDIVLALSVRASLHSVRPHFLSVRNHISVPIGQI